VPVATQRPDFKQAFAGKDQVAVIGEFKRSSPSLGAIRAEADISRQVAAYAAGGASAISVLTEPSRFGGSYEDLRTAVETVDIPVLMKDFIVSPRQVELAAVLGASAVLLIVRCLSTTQLRELAAAAVEIGVTPLIECHEAEELEPALAIEDAVIGINHRNLSTLSVDVESGRTLLERVPSDRIVVSESGVESPRQIREYLGVADAVLVGTALMRAADPAAFLKEALS
jgi:indole-3-glycerol phosphate synthase